MASCGSRCRRCLSTPTIRKFMTASTSEGRIGAPAPPVTAPTSGASHGASSQTLGLASWCARSRPTLPKRMCRLGGSLWRYGGAIGWQTSSRKPARPTQRRSHLPPLSSTPTRRLPGSTSGSLTSRRTGWRQPLSRTSASARRGRRDDRGSHEQHTRTVHMNSGSSAASCAVSSAPARPLASGPGVCLHLRRVLALSPLA